jgi:hypothetical protein
MNGLGGDEAPRMATVNGRGLEAYLNVNLGLRNGMGILELLCTRRMNGERILVYSESHILPEIQRNCEACLYSCQT